MVGRLKVSVSESVGELQNRLSKSKTASEKERLQMLYWLKTGKVSTGKEDHPKGSETRGKCTVETGQLLQREAL